MSLNFELTNQNLINVTRTSNALDAFYNSVNNGQMRLALEVFAEILPVIVDKLEADVSQNESEIKVNNEDKKTDLQENKPKGKNTKSETLVKEQDIEV